jgi:sorbitol/mannitol transport system permease protein
VGGKTNPPTPYFFKGEFVMAAAAQPSKRKIYSIRGLLALPTILFLVVMTQVPLIYTLRYSLERYNLLRPDRRAYIKLRNYERILTDDNFLVILRNTVNLTLLSVLISLALGMGLALLLYRNFPGRGVVRTMLITPFLIMPTVTAVLWKNVLFEPSFGLFSSLFRMVGLRPVAWLEKYPMECIIAIIVWQWTPFMMLILLAGLQSLSKEILEAAQIDGAGPPRIFYYIILPHLFRYIEMAVLLEVLFSLSLFGEIFVTTLGGPGISTTNLSFNIYKEAFLEWDIGKASAMGVIAVIFANIIVTFFIRMFRRNDLERAAQ